MMELIKTEVIEVIDSYGAEKYDTDMNNYILSNSNQNGENQIQKFITTNNGHNLPIPCPECGKLFAKEFDIKRHMFTHTGEKPFKVILIFTSNVSLFFCLIFF